MRDSQKTRKQLLNELHETRQQLELLAAAEVERKKAGVELRQSEEKFYKAFLSSPDMIIITSIKDGKYIEVNESFAEISGYSREELIGHTVEEFNLFVNPEEQARMTRLLQERGSLKNEEFSFRLRSGEIRRWLCSAEIINIDGETCIIAVAVDITELKKMEQALRESEEKFSKAFYASPEILAITTIKDSKYVDINDSYTLRTGYSREELISHTTTSIHIWANDDDRAKMARILQERGRVHNEEFDFRMKSGEIRTWILSLEPITIGGEPCLIGVSIDITERKLMEKTLRESEEKFSKAFRASPESIVITRLSDGAYIEVNDSFTRVFGFTRAEVIGHKSTEINTWVKPGDRIKMIRQLTERGRVSNEEYQLRTKSGEVRTVLFSGEPIECEGEHCILSITYDITAYKQMEAQALEAENLRAVDRLRTELLANVSHELRTPLASIKGFATMLIDYDKRLKNNEKREYLETIDKNADRLVELIEQLLEMSRLGVGMLSIKKTPTDVITLCRTTISEARVRSLSHNFVLDLPQKLPRINIDDRRIRQVLDNLIDNAVKYSDSGTEITLSVRKTGTELLFTVTDHGAGIPQKDLPRVFDRMFHSPLRQKTGVSGVGLGLSICKGLIEAHGGKIWIESEEGVGTRCFFTLPLGNKSGENNGEKIKGNSAPAVENDIDIRP